MANESLLAQFGLDIAPLTQSLKRATSAVKEETAKMGKEGFGELLGPIAKVVAAVGSVGAIMEGLHGAMELGSEMQELSNKTGIAVENLYGLRMAFKDSGVEAEKIGPAVAKMQKNLAASVNGGGSASVLHALGLDARTLANESPDKAFEQIGASIHKLGNPTEQAAVAMQIFGKSGAELLAVFNSPSFQNAGNVSNTAKLLGENAASFKEANEALSHVGQKISGFFVGIGSSFVPALHGVIENFEKIDFSSWGVGFGNVIGNFVTDFSDEWSKLVQFFQDSISLVFSEEGLSAALEGFLLFGAKIRDFLITVFKTPLDYFEAGFQKVIEEAMEQFGKIPLLGKTAGLSGFKATGFDDILKDVQSRGNGLTNFKNNQKNEEFLVSSDLKTKLSDLGSKLVQNLKPLTTATEKTQEANEEGRADANSKYSIPSGNFDSSDIGANKFSIIADSLERVGGGGRSALLGDNPILVENRRQSSLLQRIADNTSRAPGAVASIPAAAFAQ